jgi:hypothetical protein
MQRVLFRGAAALGVTCFSLALAGCGTASDKASPSPVHFEILNSSNDSVYLTRGAELGLFRGETMLRFEHDCGRCICGSEKCAVCGMAPADVVELATARKLDIDWDGQEWIAESTCERAVPATDGPLLARVAYSTSFELGDVVGMTQERVLAAPILSAEAAFDYPTRATVLVELH